MRRVLCLHPWIAAVVVMACGPAPSTPSPSVPAKAAEAATPVAGPRSTSDAAQATASGGATFIAPAGWSIAAQGAQLRLEGPEPGLRIAIVDTRGASAEEVVQRAWRVLDPGFVRTPGLVTRGPARHGWDERVGFTYETAPNERRVVQAQAYRRGEAWTVVLVAAGEAAFERRQAQVRSIVQSLRPRGYVRESFAGKPARVLGADRLQQITGMLARAQQRAGVPGLALSLVQDGEVVFSGGLGVRELGAPARVDERTLFMIASNTKALTTLLLARLVDEGKLRWDAPVTAVYPAFELGDPETTRKLRVKHLVCACTGLPAQDMEWLFEFEAATPRRVMALLATFQPTTRFGEAYQYSNLLVAAAGFIGGAVAYPGKELGAAYDEAMRTRVFGPLDMTDTTFDAARALAGDHASPHAEDIDGAPRVATMAVNRLTAPDRPDGGAWSSVRDLTRVVQMELARGELPDGTRFVSEANLLARREPQIAVDADASYGMGLIIDHRWGVPVVHHGGTLVGFRGDMFWLPEHGVGGVLLTNADNGGMLLGPFLRKTLEVLFDGEAEAEEDLEVAIAAHAAARARRRARLVLPPAADVVATLARRYTSGALGDILVDTGGGRCVLDFGAWRSPVATQAHDDGTTTLVTIEPGLIGLEFVVAQRDGRRALVLRDAQHEYTFLAAP